MSYSVAQRTQEIGVRMALGAQRWNVLRLILGSGVRTLAVGLFIGGAAALAISRWLQSLLFETSSFDLLTYGAAGGLLFIAGLLACWLPAHRATQVHPMEALRFE
jgi:putative ABC transport system permease protein